MKHFKWYAVGLIILLIYTVRSELLIKKYKKLSASVATEQIEKDNSVELPAIVENDSIEIQVAKKETIRVTEFKYIYADPPKSDDDIAQVNEYIDFFPDESIDVYDILEKDSRVALTHYKFTSDIMSATFKILYDYKHESFEITPHDLDFDVQKDFRYTFSLVATSESQIGVFLQYRVWRFSVGSGLLINKEIEGLALVGLGWEF